jgi:hypothetical protein
MKITQTIKLLVIGLVIVAGAVAVATPSTVSAAQCGGVQTSLVSCEQDGQCLDGEQPFEGTKPVSDVDKASYKEQYGHDYGACMNGKTVKEASLQSTGVWGILLLGINILTAGVGVVAIVGVVYGSILYTSAGGSAEQIKKAMTIFTNIVIGVVVYALMYSGLNFLIPGGLFN